MTRAFSIKRRKQDTRRPDGQSSQRSLHALGIGIGRSSPHVASKRGHAHIYDPAADPAQRFVTAQAWSQATGRPLPPHLRARQPLAPPAAMDLRARLTSYLTPAVPHLGALLDPLPAGDLLDSPLLTRAQRRRALHKAGQHGERPAGFKPAAQVIPGPRAPRSPAAKRRAAKNAAQRRRHLDRYWREHPLTAAERARLDAGLPILAAVDEAQ